MSVELYLVRVLSPQLFASLMPITHPQFTPHPEHLKHLEDLEDLEQLEQLEQLEHLKHFEDLEDIPSDNSLTPPRSDPEAKKNVHQEARKGIRPMI